MTGRLSKAICFYLMVVFSCMANAQTNGSDVVIGQMGLRLEQKGKDRIYVYRENSLQRTCHLDRPILDGIKLSFDKKALIVNAKKYLIINDLINCNDSKRVVEQQIPNSVGWLTDINITHKIYIAVDMEYSTPMGCVATVGKLPSAKNLISMPGTNIVKGKRKNSSHIHCVEESFISPDARYIALVDINCRDDIPNSGVWDIKTDKKVIFSTNEFTKKEIQSKCNALFGIADTLK